MLAPKPKPIRPFVAATALYRLRANPQDSGQFTLALEALEGNSELRLYRRLRNDPDGQRVLSRQPAILAALSDRERLRALPPDSLGSHYLAWTERQGTTAAELAQVVEAGRAGAGRDPRRGDPHFVETWMRDTHDLYHVVTGYDTDVLGEMCVAAFVAAQTHNSGLWASLLVGFGVIGRKQPRSVPLALRAMAVGRRAAFLPAQDWVALLPEPLREVRQRLRVETAPAYEPFYGPLV